MICSRNIQYTWYVYQNAQQLLLKILVQYTWYIYQNAQQPLLKILVYNQRYLWHVLNAYLVQIK